MRKGRRPCERAFSCLCDDVVVIVPTRLIMLLASPPRRRRRRLKPETLVACSTDVSLPVADTPIERDDMANNMSTDEIELLKKLEEENR